VSVSGLSTGAYTTTLLVMVDEVKGEGRAVHPPPTPAWADFTIMTECTSKNGHFPSVYSVVSTMSVLAKIRQSTDRPGQPPKYPLSHVCMFCP
jgi:hypothetical protein